MQVHYDELEGLFAVPKNHPITCANPAPWKIEQIKIVRTPNRVRCLIRNETKESGSMWFGADQCFIDTEATCNVFLRDALNLRI